MSTWPHPGPEAESPLQGEWNAEADIGIDPVERQLSTRC
jgi:hypothetical protein